jgi:hypothetical protein
VTPRRIHLTGESRAGKLVVLQDADGADEVHVGADHEDPEDCRGGQNLEDIYRADGVAEKTDWEGVHEIYIRAE